MKQDDIETVFWIIGMIALVLGCGLMWGDKQGDPP